VGFEAVVFDLDGLLVDSEPLWRRAQIAVFGRYGLTLTDAQCRSTKGRAIGEVAAYWHRRAGWSGPPPASVAAEVTDEVVRLLRRDGRLLPGARQAVATCQRAGLGLAVASSSSRQLIEAALGALQIRSAFDAVCSAEDVGAGKPDPAVYLAACRALAVPPDRCVALEDSALGCQAARAAGIVCAAVPEDPVDADVAAAADLVLGSLWELPLSWAELAAIGAARGS
jgi:HAD superfamily hydrolase (TIGR01509 family)